MYIFTYIFYLFIYLSSFLYILSKNLRELRTRSETEMYDYIVEGNGRLSEPPRCSCWEPLGLHLGIILGSLGTLSEAFRNHYINLMYGCLYFYVDVTHIPGICIQVARTGPARWSVRAGEWFPSAEGCQRPPHPTKLLLGG